MQTLVRPFPKSELIEDFVNCSGLTEEMKERITNYLLSLYGVKENTKLYYLSKIKLFGIFLAKREIVKFEDANSRDINLFLSRYDNENTLNLYIHAFRSFYRFLDRKDTITHLKLYKNELEQVTLSETLSPDEVALIASEAGKRREMYKILTLALYESCARISEFLNLRLGDAVFSSVTEKERK